MYRPAAPRSIVAKYARKVGAAASAHASRRKHPPLRADTSREGEAELAAAIAYSVEQLRSDKDTATLIPSFKRAVPELSRLMKGEDEDPDPDRLLYLFAEWFGRAGEVRAWLQDTYQSRLDEAVRHGERAPVMVLTHGLMSTLSVVNGEDFKDWLLHHQPRPRMYFGDTVWPEMASEIVAGLDASVRRRIKHLDRAEGERLWQSALAS
jgi:hypothetical protein